MRLITPINTDRNASARIPPITTTSSKRLEPRSRMSWRMLRVDTTDIPVSSNCQSGWAICKAASPASMLSYTFSSARDPMSLTRARTIAMWDSGSTMSRKASGVSRRIARSESVPATVANESDDLRPQRSRTACTLASASSTHGSSQPRSLGHRTTISIPIVPPNSRSTWARASDAGAPWGNASAIRLSASIPKHVIASRTKARQPETTIVGAWRIEKAAMRFAARPAKRDDLPSPMPRQNRVEAKSGVRSVTAAKLAMAPAAAAIPNVRTASIRAAVSDAKPIAVTRLVRPQAAPTRCIAPEDAARGFIPRRTLRRISSMK